MEHRRYSDFNSFIAGHDDMCEQGIEFFAEYYKDSDMIPKSVIFAYLNGCIIDKRNVE